MAAVRAFVGIHAIPSHSDLALLLSWGRVVRAGGTPHPDALAALRAAETTQRSGPAEYRSVVAVRAGGPEVLEVVRRTLPEPRRGETRVRVEACGVSAVDVQMRQGLSTYPPRFPFTPGYTAVGVVDAVGEGVTAVAPGDRVVVLTETGGYAEYVFVRRHPMMRIPDGLDAGEVVAVALNYLVAHQALSRAARIQRGQVVLVTGAAGGIGTAIVQLGQLLGLRMYGAADAAKYPWLTDHGVVPIGSRGADIVDAVDAVRRLEPEGLDAVLDGLGGEWVEHALTVLRSGGVLVEYANPGSPGRTLRLLLRAVRHNLAGRGARIRSYSTGLWRLDRRPLLAAWATLYEMLEAGRIRPVIAGRLPLSEAARAHTLLEGGDAIGALVLIASPAESAEG
ncbi:NADPH:quinone reductase [Arthrobacter sp. ok909]|uniref:zinc-binding dehydrogenase n=1 Tax=Arthrobacter sp. ok909 TaxID=1761746 RepID=UPI00089253AA|nr:zinc-binding dehydrogenase [Arthrobacter sp. ok909]SDP40675.1 NADPH:quinone reductase [Arthrobacter sp. ok909]